jgi:hypothetical protein
MGNNDFMICDNILYFDDVFFLTELSHLQLGIQNHPDSRISTSFKCLDVARLIIKFIDNVKKKSYEITDKCSIICECSQIKCLLSL